MEDNNEFDNNKELNNLFYNGFNLISDLKQFSILEFKKTETSHYFNTIPQPSFNKKFELLIENLTGYHNRGYSIKIYCSSKNQVKRFNDIFEESDNKLNPILIEKSIYKGFINHDDKIVCYSDHEIFDRYHKFNVKAGFSVKNRATLNELNQLDIGDYVTHIDHGIGIFGGLQKI